MARIAYRLWTNKCDIEYVQAGFTQKQAEQIIEYLWDVDEDYTSKKEYIKNAKDYLKDLKKELGLEVSIDLAFGLPNDIGYRYCSKCDCFYWEDNGCECIDC